MPDQDIFQETTTENLQTEDTTHVDPFVDKLNKIKNENGEPKYKDVDTALDALEASQKFIEQLKQEKRQAEELAKHREEELKTRESVQDLLNKSSQPAQPQETLTTSTNTEGLSAAEVEKILEQRLAAREKQASSEGNLNQVISKLKANFGDQAAAEIKRKSEELGMTPESIKELAKGNPKLVLSLFGQSTSVSDTPTQSTVSSPDTNNLQEKALPKVEKGKGATNGGMTSKELVNMWKLAGDYVNK